MSRYLTMVPMPGEAGVVLSQEGERDSSVGAPADLFCGVLLFDDAPASPDR